MGVLENVVLLLLPNAGGLVAPLVKLNVGLGGSTDPVAAANENPVGLVGAAFPEPKLKTFACVAGGTTLKPVFVAPNAFDDPNVAGVACGLANAAPGVVAPKVGAVLFDPKPVFGAVAPNAGVTVPAPNANVVEGVSNGCAAELPKIDLLVPKLLLAVPKLGVFEVPNELLCVETGAPKLGGFVVPKLFAPKELPKEELPVKALLVVVFAPKVKVGVVLLPNVGAEVFTALLPNGEDVAWPKIGALL